MAVIIKYRERKTGGAECSKFKSKLTGLKCNHAWGRWEKCQVTRHLGQPWHATPWKLTAWLLPLFFFFFCKWFDISQFWLYCRGRTRIFCIIVLFCEPRLKHKRIAISKSFRKVSKSDDTSRKIMWWRGGGGGGDVKRETNSTLLFFFSHLYYPKLNWVT